MEWKDVDWIKLSQERDKWRAHVKKQINLLIP
jgi:hypothetical protein